MNKINVRLLRKKVKRVARRMHRKSVRLRVGLILKTGGSPTIDSVYIPARLFRGYAHQAQLALVRRSYESEELECAECCFVPQDRILEIGMGLGFTSAYLLKNSLVSAVVSIDANDAALKLAGHLHKANQVHVERKLGLIWPEHDSGSRALSFDVDADISSSRVIAVDGGETGVTAPRVDLLMAIEDSAATGILMDGEGAETVFLDVALPASIQGVVCELHPQIIGWETIYKILGRLTEQGFVSLCIRPSGRNLVVGLSRSPSLASKTRLC